MTTYVDTFLESETPSLELLVKVHDDNRFAALGLDLRALHGAAFAIGAAELGIAYAHFVQFGEALAGFAPGMLQELDYEIRERRVAQRTWAELALDEGEFWYRLFEMQLARREGALEALARGDIIRAEIVEVYRENPSVKKIIATGSLLGLTYLGLTFSAVQIMKERAAPQCRAAALQSAQHDKQMIQTMALREGRFTAEHRAAWQAVDYAYKTNVGACGSALEVFKVEANFKDLRFALVLGPPESAQDKGHR